MVDARAGRQRELAGVPIDVDESGRDAPSALVRRASLHQARGVAEAELVGFLREGGLLPEEGR